MGNQNIAEDDLGSQNLTNNTANRNDPLTMDVHNINFRRKDSEDSDTIQQCSTGGAICGVNGVFCSSGNILDSIFPYLSRNDTTDTDATPSSPRDVRTIVGTKSNLITPSSKPVRRGRFLVWPVLPECGTSSLAATTRCNDAPIALTTSSSGSSE